MAATNFLTRARLIGWTAAALLLAVGTMLLTELPRWQSGGARSMQVASAGIAAKSQTCPQQGATVAIIGDSHVAGSRSGEGAAAFGEVFEQALAGRASVVRFGVEGHTALAGEAAWQGRDLLDADLVILAYGTNDAAPRGWMRDKTPVPVADFKASLLRQIAAWRGRGHAVALLAPPPGGSPAIAQRLAPYRQATGEVGRASGIAVLDPADAFAACPSAQPVLVYDALHMNAAGHQCLGTWLAQQFCPAGQ
jgi:lysophospholipase L1-like esterase